MSDSVQSPTTLVLNYLKSQGLQPNAQNIRRTLEANARNPGLVPGLANEAPPAPDAEPRQHSAVRMPTNNKSVAKEIESDNSLPEPPMPPTQDVENSTQPTQKDDEISVSLPDMLLPAAGVAITGADALLNRRQPANPGDSYEGDSDLIGPDDASAGYSDAEYAGRAEPPPFRVMPPDAITGPSEAPMIAADPMQAALSKAVGEPAALTGAQTTALPQSPSVPQIPQAPQQPIPLQDATSGPPIALPDNGAQMRSAADELAQMRNAPRALSQGPGLLEEFMNLIRGIGRR